MNVNYKDEQETARHIAEFEKILTDSTYESTRERILLEAELQMLKGNKDNNGNPQATVESNNDKLLKITFEQENNIFSMLVCDKHGNPEVPCIRAKTVIELLCEVLDEEESI